MYRFEDGHQCRPFHGFRGDDSEFPKKYQHDPWCWAYGYGFHRLSARAHRHYLRAHRGSRRVGPDFIAPAQAFRLGFRLGTSNTGGGTPEFAMRFCEIHHRAVFHDAEIFARLGYAARNYHAFADEVGDNRKQIAAFHREVFHAAYRAMYSSIAELLGPWEPLLELAADGRDLTGVQQRWAQTARDIPYGSGNATANRDSAASAVLDALQTGHHGGHSRSFVRLFAQAEPSTSQAETWLETVITAIENAHGHDPNDVPPY